MQVEIGDLTTGLLRGATGGDFSPNLFYNDTTTNLGGSATYTGTARDVGVAAGTLQRFNTFNAMFFADQAGTARIECSNDNSTWRRATTDQALSANSVVTLTVPVLTRYYRVILVNGATPQTAMMINSGFGCA